MRTGRGGLARAGVAMCLLSLAGLEGAAQADAFVVDCEVLANADQPVPVGLRSVLASQPRAKLKICQHHGGKQLFFVSPPTRGHLGVCRRVEHPLSKDAGGEWEASLTSVVWMRDGAEECEDGEGYVWVKNVSEGVFLSLSQTLSMLLRDPSIPLLIVPGAQQEESSIRARFVDMHEAGAEVDSIRLPPVSKQPGAAHYTVTLRGGNRGWALEVDLVGADWRILRATEIDL